MALGSTQPLTETISWRKGGRCVRLTTYHHPMPLSRNMGALTSWNPLGHSRPVIGVIYVFIYSWITAQKAVSANTEITGLKMKSYLQFLAYIVNKMTAEFAWG